MHSLGGENLGERKSLEELALDGTIQLGGSSRNGSVWIEFDWLRTETRGALS